MGPFDDPTPKEPAEAPRPASEHELDEAQLARSVNLSGPLDWIPADVPVLAEGVSRSPAAASRYATGGVLLLLSFGLPAAVVCLGLWGGCIAADLPPALALVGLVNVLPVSPGPVGLLVWLSRPAAVVGALAWMFS